MATIKNDMNPVIHTGSVDAMQYIAELALGCADPKIVEVNGRTYLVSSYGRSEEIHRADPPRPNTFKTFSLEGLITFLRANPDRFTHNPLIVKVCSPTHVIVETPLYGVENARDVIASCSVDVPRISFDRYMPAEDLMIELMTKFEDTDNRKTVLAVLGRLREEQSEEVADDGFSQRVTVKAGVSKTDEVTVTNPVYLNPRRAFHEVEQPGSPFTLRFKQGPMAALFESDGGQWQIEAVANIADWLSKELDDINVVIVA